MNSSASPSPTPRPFTDEVLQRVPPLAAGLRIGVQRAPLGSDLRRRLVNAALKRAFAAIARSDVDVVISGYEPDAEIVMSGMEGVGIRDRYVGREGSRMLMSEIDDVFSEWLWTCEEVVDGGDRLAIRTNFQGVGRISGVTTTVTDGGTAIKVSHRGLAQWQGWFVGSDGWESALEAVGLSADV